MQNRFTSIPATLIMFAFACGHNCGASDPECFDNNGEPVINCYKADVK